MFARLRLYMSCVLEAFQNFHFYLFFCSKKDCMQKGYYGIIGINRGQQKTRSGQFTLTRKSTIRMRFR